MNVQEVNLSAVMRLHCLSTAKSNSSQSLLTVQEMFPLPKKYVARIARTPDASDRSTLYEDLKEYGRFTGLCWLMSPEPAPQAKLPIPTIEEIIYSEEFIQTRGYQQQLDCLVRKAKVNEGDIVLVNEVTVGQRTIQPGILQEEED